MSFGIGDREVVALLGRNGAAKTTTLRSIMGLNPAEHGTIIFDGKDISRNSPQVVSRLGITLVPETRDPFVLLTGKETIMLGYRHESPSLLDPLIKLFTT